MQLVSLPNIFSCDVCGGTNVCLGCDGVAWSGASYDQCGVCGGTGLSCIGCDGVLWSGKLWDSCKVCEGNNACVGCDCMDSLFCIFTALDVAFSYSTYDMCGDCAGNNSCLGCDGVAYSGVTEDVCGRCGGTETVQSDCNAKVEKTSLVAMGVFIGITLLAVGVAIAAFFIYKVNIPSHVQLT